MRTMRDSTPEVEHFVQTALVFIDAASTYAESGEYDPHTDGMIRRLRVVIGALGAALGSIQFSSGGPGLAGPLMMGPQP
jgi:hypothetical protein